MPAKQRGGANRSLSATEAKELEELRELPNQRNSIVSDIQSLEQRRQSVEYFEEKRGSISYSAGSFSEDTQLVREDGAKLLETSYSMANTGVTRNSLISGLKPLSKETTELEIKADQLGAKKRRLVNGIFHKYIAPVIFTVISFWLRYYKIGDNNTVIWDEAHFAKFGSFYNRHTFYHDVHPPLGKMLCGLSEWLVGYQASANPDYNFDAGSTYPAQINYFGMRLFQVFFSSALTPIAWFTCRSLKKNLWTCYLVTLMVCLESSFIVLGKFVLLDSFLFFFTATTFLCLANVNRLRKFEGKSRKFNLWLLLLGLSIGCVCCVKWVGLFVTSVVGVYVIVDLWAKFWEPNFRILTYAHYWFTRIIALICIPVVVYLTCFKLHLDLLYLPGDGSASMNTIFQANMRATDIVSQPRFVQFGDELTLRSQGPNSNLLHSHQQVYPAGSGQHQVTTYGFKDSNNNWQIENPRTARKLSGYLKDGDTLRLKHLMTGANLHSHEIPGHVSKNYFEVSGYGSEEIGDEKDDWIVEVVSQLYSSNETYRIMNESGDQFHKFIHPVSTTFRLKHKQLGCYLGTTGKSYPIWGFQQGEVVCLDAAPKDSWKSYIDTSANWNIESVVSSGIPIDYEYEYPKSNFLKDFIQIQRSMAASNNALTPDPSKADSIASSWWEWPIMRSGIRMSTWSLSARRYYMFGNPIIIWFTTACVVVYSFIMFSISRRWKSQELVLDEVAMWNIFTSGIVPLLGYILHYLPFIAMGRVTYFHHYMPALYFAMFMSGFAVDYLTINMNKRIRDVIYFLLFVVIIGSFWLFSPTCLGMVGHPRNYKYLNWFPTWTMSDYQPFSITLQQFFSKCKSKLNEYI